MGEEGRMTGRPTGAMGGVPGAGTLRERVGALRNLPPFLALVWQTSPPLAATSLAVRLVRALLPVATLYVGKLIIDEAIRLTGAGGTHASLLQWLGSGAGNFLLLLLGAEMGLAVLSDILGRVAALVEGLLSEKFGNETSIRLMEHAATLDLEDF
jgi:ATP-binding cassette, subfamily B, bacterial